MKRELALQSIEPFLDRWRILEGERANVTDAIEHVRRVWKDQMECLNLSSLNLSWLPLVPIKFTHLRELNLSDNRFTFLPLEVGELTQLQYLKLSGNQLNSLPDTLANLSQLLQLDLARNKLTQFPQVILELTQLQYLRVSSNRLTNLPHGIQRLSRLKYLKLSGNKLSSLPLEIGALKNIRYLYVSNNNLSDLPMSLGNLNKTEKFLYRNTRIPEPQIEAITAAWQEINANHTFEERSENRLLWEKYQYNDPTFLDRMQDGERIALTRLLEHLDTTQEFHIAREEIAKVIWGRCSERPTQKSAQIPIPYQE